MEDPLDEQTEHFCRLALARYQELGPSTAPDAQTKQGDEHPPTTSEVIKKLPVVATEKEPLSGTGVAGMAVLQPRKVSPKVQVGGGSPVKTAPTASPTAVQPTDESKHAALLQRMALLERAAVASQTKFDEAIMLLKRATEAQTKINEAQVKAGFEKSSREPSPQNPQAVLPPGTDPVVHALLRELIAASAPRDHSQSKPAEHEMSKEGKKEIILLKDRMPQLHHMGCVRTIMGEDGRVGPGAPSITELADSLVIALLVDAVDELEVHYKIMNLPAGGAALSALQQESELFIAATFQAAYDATIQADAPKAFREARAAIPQAIRGIMRGYDLPTSKTAGAVNHILSDTNAKRLAPTTPKMPNRLLHAYKTTAPKKS